MKEKETEIISKEMIEDVVSSINKSMGELTPKEEGGIDYEKVKEVLSSFEGLSIKTMVALIVTTLLMLPMDAITAILDMGKQVIKMKMMAAVECLFKKAEDSTKTDD